MKLRPGTPSMLAGSRMPCQWIEVGWACRRLATRTLTVADPAAFVAHCPVAFAPLWTFLQEICPNVLTDADPTASLQAIADSAIGLGDVGACTAWTDAGTVGSLDALLDDCGVARLVLTLVEFVRQLLERQAIRRMEGGRLPDEKVERMGEALARLEEKVIEMKNAFGLAGEALDLDLGPLGRLNGPGTGTGNG